MWENVTVGKNVIRVGENAINCRERVENWRKHKMHDIAILLKRLCVLVALQPYNPAQAESFDFRTEMD